MKTMTIEEAPVGMPCTLPCGCRVKVKEMNVRQWYFVDVLVSCPKDYVSCNIFGGSKKLYGAPSPAVVPNYKEVSIDPLSLELIEDDLHD